MIRRPPRSTRTDTLFPYTTLFRSRERLGDLRGVVQALRDARGLDLATALRALAAPLPRPALRLEIDDDVQVTDPGVAEASLRLVQEALTNSARSEERRVGKGCVRTCRSRGSAYH